MTTAHETTIKGGYSVSILTQPVGWVQPQAMAAGKLQGDVSILTQPVGWVQRATDEHAHAANSGFNPHPACWLGATRFVAKMD